MQYSRRVPRTRPGASRLPADPGKRPPQRETDNRSTAPPTRLRRRDVVQNVGVVCPVKVETRDIRAIDVLKRRVADVRWAAAIGRPVTVRRACGRGAGGQVEDRCQLRGEVRRQGSYGLG